MPAQADIPNFFYQRKQKNDSDIIQDYKVEVEVDIISCIYVVLIKSSDCVTDSNHTVDIERLDININGIFCKKTHPLILQYLIPRSMATDIHCSFPVTAIKL